MQDKLNSVYRGNTVLMAAVNSGNLQNIEALLNAGADVNQQSVNGSAFSLALYRDDADSLKILLQHGAIAELVNNTKTAVQIAYESKSNSLNLLLELTNGWQQQDANRSPILKNYFSSCNTEGFNEVLNAGADANIFLIKEQDSLLNVMLKTLPSSKPKRTPNSRCDQKALIKNLIEAGASTTQHKPGAPSPLYFALEKQNNDLADLLISTGASCDISLAKNDNILILAVRSAHSKLIQQCVNEGVNINYQSPKIRRGNALYASLEYKHPDITEQLLKFGAKFPSEEAYLIDLFRMALTVKQIELMLVEYLKGERTAAGDRGVLTGIRRAKKTLGDALDLNIDPALLAQLKNRTQEK
jgi:ankyrin repeat protein